MAWNTMVRGRNLVKRTMTDEERKKYGLPLIGREKVVAEMESINEDRMMNLWEDRDVLDLEPAET